MDLMWSFPRPDPDADDLVAAGADLRPETLVAAYAAGYAPNKGESITKKDIKKYWKSLKLKNLMLITINEDELLNCWKRKYKTYKGSVFN